MERSAIRDSTIRTQEPRITLRSIRATHCCLLGQHCKKFSHAFVDSRDDAWLFAHV
jgi:hypothetical protein